MDKCPVCDRNINKPHEHHDHLSKCIKEYIAKKLGESNWHNLLKKQKKEDCYNALMTVINSSERFPAQNICEQCNTFEGSKQHIDFLKNEQCSLFSFSVDELRELIVLDGEKRTWNEDKAEEIFISKISKAMKRLCDEAKKVLKDNNYV